MKKELSAAWHTIVPAKGDPHGPLPPLLVLLTIVTGLVDAFSYIELGRVFVANMTGNVVFLAFSLGGAAGFVWWASVLGVAAFLIGAFLGGRIAAAFGSHRGRHLLIGTSAQGALFLVAVVAAALFARPYGAVAMVVLIVLLGTGMGLQNATARALAVPDLTTTVLTLTLVGVTADSRLAGGRGSRIGRRVVSVLSMFLGAFLGAMLATADFGVLVLVAATVLLLIVMAASALSARAGTSWSARPGTT